MVKKNDLRRRAHRVALRYRFDKRSMRHAPVELLRCCGAWTKWRTYALVACTLFVIAPAWCAASPAGSVPFDRMSIATLEQRLHSGQLSAVDLTEYFINRIRRYDENGPHIDSVLEINPDALRIARKLDDESALQKASQPLFGIPILLKGNIDTGDRMLTTAGSLALAGAPATKDATLVAKLRKAGAIILGKANLSEFANFRSMHSVGPWSAVGGLVHNPYILDRSACSSSSGPAAAEAAGFAVVTIGTETDGSIVCPSSMNGVIGVKPTLGLVSRTGIVPISHTQDTAGPIARSVPDAAAILTVIAGSDRADPATKNANEHKLNYVSALRSATLRGKRIGIVRAFDGTNPLVLKIINHTIDVLREHGATVVDPVVIPHLGDYHNAEWTSLRCNFKVDINTYLSTRHGLAVHSLSEIIAFNQAHRAGEMPWFGQGNLIASQAEPALSSKHCRDALRRAKELSGPMGIDTAMKHYNLDALMALTAGPAPVVDLLGHFSDRHPSGALHMHFVGGSSTPAAVAGYPDVTVPAGYVHCLPVGVSFFGSKWSDAVLLSIAYAFERAAHVDKRPMFLPNVTYCQQWREPAY